MMTILNVTVNGKQHEDLIPDNLLLIDYLRDVLNITGTKSGCDGGECGACTVLINGNPHLSCITLATTLSGKEIETIESLASNGRLSKLQQMFHQKLGTQCGFCTPGMIMAAESLLRNNSKPGDDEIRKALEGNLCRCTGYVKILESVKAVIAKESDHQVRIK
ncbi:MAG: 2Fe-2S iron-sulfur cluster binding domain-containing protein [Gammaproteobacteria bacterium]|nr:2Fe-2S iron-sulfur cluster binding domain-containing protein [Gammaproteobacteria bacterium]